MYNASRPEPFSFILEAMGSLLKRLNVVAECREVHLGLWSCPPFLFVVLGLINIAAMLASWLLANSFVVEPEAAAMIVIAVTAVIFVLGNFIIHGFTQIAEANRIKSEFISIISHQLRSPLAIFKWTLDAMDRDRTLPQGDAETGGRDTKHAAVLRENTEKMIQLVNMLLEVSRIEAGRFTLRREEVSLEGITAEFVRSVAPYAEAGGIVLGYEPAPDLPSVHGDREKLKMVVQNLVDNAVRYTPAGGRVTVSLAPVGAAVEWRVEDTGMGIPRAEQRYIFQKFFRASAASRRQSVGSGLGLYIARSIVEALGGKIGFQSEEGKGSTFWFQLPVYKASAAT